LQEKLELITGIPVGNQKLAIYHDDADLQPVKVFDDDQRPLGFYSPADFQVLKVRERLSASAKNADVLTYSGSGYQSIDHLHWPINGSQWGRQI
jgi:hypothetical protein